MSTQHHLVTEAAIYQRLGPHPNITTFVAFKDGNVYLERLRCTLRQRLIDIQTVGLLPAANLLLLWASQVAQAFKHIHSRGVFQVDIATYNMLVDWSDNIKLSDFAGSSIDGSEPAMCASFRAEHPRCLSTSPSIRSELFALGSAFYEMETLNEPYQDKSYDEIDELYVADQYPDTAEMVLGEIIRKCWLRQYQSAEEMIRDIDLIRMRLEQSNPSSMEGTATKEKNTEKTNTDSEAQPEI
ncbi:kinase-like protein [Penicillium nucicola]|uniref:kinase-like protein n=1 Tax=Penicillium nucicola TaxID=1850975 RepID=UPI002545179F|nr:kinase-like protein [Penicillium nucicola]KAJ5761939.1 kinase-like protein [Penicillium nucicola]